MNLFDHDAGNGRRGGIDLTARVRTAANLLQKSETLNIPLIVDTIN